MSKKNPTHRHFTIYNSQLFYEHFFAVDYVESRGESIHIVLGGIALDADSMNVIYFGRLSDGCTGGFTNNLVNPSRDIGHGYFRHRAVGIEC